ncbi:Cytokine receptor-like factor 3 [Daphnia sinensis]|uniref:Cytokine receptor-like factor 3 n=1 Tax=Daphnia sinensis TaxID=1820382 RepID=A0AAD5KJC2_9CRUS|nr:Cytokine receptor-like factor 3 [Daphnia sinensis]
MDTSQFSFQVNRDVQENETNLNAELSNEISCNNVTSFENISFFLATHQYPNGLNLNQKRTLRKAATNFSLVDNKLYYIGKNKTDKRLVILDEEGKKQVFEECHGSSIEGGHGGQKKTLEKVESLFFWRGMVKDVIRWVTACEICRYKEKRCNQLYKKAKTADLANDTSQSSDTCQDDITTGENPTNGLYETAKYSMEQVEQCLQKIQNYEVELVNMSKAADVEIDDMLDFLLAKIMKLISRRKREMKIQVEEQKIRSLNLLKTFRKQFEGRLKTIRKLILDVEKATKGNQLWPSLKHKSAVNASLPEMPKREEIGGIWSVFNTEEAHEEIGNIIKKCSNIYEQPPYIVSDVLQLPASLRIQISHAACDDQPLFKDAYEMGNFTPTRSLRLYHCIHNPAAHTGNGSVFHENQIQILKGFSKENYVYLNCLEPHQVYAIYISYREEGSSVWSPWSFPFLASTSIPGYCWETINSDWKISSDLREASKIANSPTPLYSSSAQYFPGCRISVTLEKIPDIVHGDDGFALIDQWVQGGTLNQEGTFFVNVEGKLFINGKLCDAIEPLSLVNTTLTFDCHPNIETIADGLRMQITVHCHNESHIVYWSVRNHITNVYFGVRFHQPGARVKIG